MLRKSIKIVIEILDDYDCLSRHSINFLKIPYVHQDIL